MDNIDNLSAAALKMEMDAMEKKRAMEEDCQEWQDAEGDVMEDDEEEEDDLPQGPGFNPQIWPPLPGKQPRGYEEGYDDYDEEIMETDRKYKSGFKRSLRCKEHYGEPDLTAYFAQWPDMEEFAQIAMCRTFANYLAQKMRARQPRQEKKIKYGK